MNWIGDKIALLLVSMACAAAAWAILHYSGEWFFPAITLFTVVSMFIDNRRLRALLKKHGIDPKSK